MTYEYLKKYNKDLYKHLEVVPWPSNIFYEVTDKEITEGEKLLYGNTFPSELKEFYKTIGAGCLVSPHILPIDYKFYNSNAILPPVVAATFAQAIVRWHEKPFWDPVECEDHWMANECLESFTPGDLPFFEIGDSSSFMILKPNSENPNAVWWMGYEKIEDSFERFIRNLYFQDPAYYSEGWADHIKS